MKLGPSDTNSTTRLGEGVEGDEIEGHTAGILIYVNREQGQSSGEGSVFWVFTTRLSQWMSTIPYFLFYPRQALESCFSTRKRREGRYLPSGKLLHCYVFTVPILACFVGLHKRVKGDGIYIFPKWRFTQRDRKTHADRHTNQITDQTNTRSFRHLALFEAACVCVNVGES